MEGTPPRRRISDRDRRRWSDERLDDFANKVDGLADHVDDLENHTDALIGLLATVKEMSEMLQAQGRRIDQLRNDMGTVQRALIDMKQKNGEEHEATRKVAASAQVLSWPLVGRLIVAFAGCVATLVVPFLLAGGHP